MTAKEKANQLVDRMYLIISNNGQYTGEHSIPFKFEEAKKCALVAVHEIMRVAPWGGDIDAQIEDGSKEFYMNVKQEIEKL